MAIFLLGKMRWNVQIEIKEVYFSVMINQKFSAAASKQLGCFQPWKSTEFEYIYNAASPQPT